MNHRFVFFALVMLSFSAPLAHAAGERESSPTDRSINAPIAGAPAPSGCSSMFEILDANKDDYVNKDEAKKSAEATANWKSLDSNLDNRLSLEEFCTGAK